MFQILIYFLRLFQKNYYSWFWIVYFYRNESGIIYFWFLKIKIFIHTTWTGYVFYSLETKIYINLVENAAQKFWFWFSETECIAQFRFLLHDQFSGKNAAWNNNKLVLVQHKKKLNNGCWNDTANIISEIRYIKLFLW